MTFRPALLALCLLLAVPPAVAQSHLSGHVSTMVDAVPHRARSPELRSRVFAREQIDLGQHVRFDVAGFLEGLVAAGDGTTRDAVAEVDEASIQLRFSRLDLRAGFSRAVWGRLDELQPSDVVNPLDLSKFFFESREAARMPVALVRARVPLNESTTVELIAVPRFRAGRFDRLDELTSPFNVSSLPFAIVTERPSGSVWREVQGGGRLSSSIGRVDWSAGAYRGFRPLPVYSLSNAVAGLSAPVVGVQITAAYPRFTMISGDFETAFSRWTLRGEAVVSREDAIQARRSPVTAAGRTIQAGIGADRSLRGYRILGEAIWSDAAVETPSPIDPFTNLPPVFDRQSLASVGIVEKTFARGTRLVRGFGIYDSLNRNGIARAVAAMSLREGLWIEGTAAWLSGQRRGFFGNFIDDDFVSLRLIKHF